MRRFNIESRRLLNISIWVFLVFQFCHAVSLPLMVTWDGNWYIHLSQVIGGVATEWDFLRGPVFPILLKISFLLLGQTGLAVVGLQVMFVVGAVLLLARVITQLSNRETAAACVLLLAPCPALVTYQHCVLTEVGSFFFLALFVCIMTGPRFGDWNSVAMSAGAMVLGYYYRSSLIWLLPIFLTALIVRSELSWRAVFRAPRVSIRDRTLRVLGAKVASLVLLPCLLIWPWASKPEVQARTGESVLIYGLVKQAVIPVDSPLWGNSSVYRDAIIKSLRGNVFPPEGIGGGLEYAPVGLLTPLAPKGTRLFIGTALSHPSAYLQGVFRSLDVFVNPLLAGGENEGYLHRLIATDENAGLILGGPPRFPPLGGAFVVPSADSVVSRVMGLLTRPYRMLIAFGVLVVIVLFIRACLCRDAAMLIFASVPLAYLLLNALILNSQDRMAVPTYPMILCAIPVALHRSAMFYRLPEVYLRRALILGAAIGLLLLIAPVVGVPGSHGVGGASQEAGSSPFTAGTVDVKKYEGLLIRAEHHSVPSEAGKVFVVREGMKRWVLSNEWMTRNGYTGPTAIHNVPQAVVDAVPTDKRPPLQ